MGRNPSHMGGASVAVEHWHVGHRGRMKFVIIGSGLIGVTTAYFLRRQGHAVTVIDRADGPGQQTSFANGGLLTPSMAAPWNAPGSWRVLLASLGRSDSALQLRLRALPGLMGWGLTFLRNSTAARFERNRLSNFQLALYSLDAMRSLRQQTHIEYGRTALGTLSIFRDDAAFDRAALQARCLVPEGLPFRKLSAAEAVALEPALAPIARRLAGAIHYEADETGNAYRFCVALADQARQEGVEFCFNTDVSSLETRSGQIAAAVSCEKRFVADRYIVAAGSYSTELLRRIGINLPVRPAKGYSVTFEDPGLHSPRIPIVDDHHHAAIIPIDGKIRVAGMAEFAGYDLSLDPRRIHSLQKLLQDILPRAQFHPSTAKPWCGLRPASVDGVPIIGPTPIANLLVNTGHGHLGWTMAAGSAKLLADLVSGDPLPLDPAPYALARFGADL